MANRKVSDAFVELDEDQVEIHQEKTVVDDLKSARVKGTWTMYWGASRYVFEDGKRYRLPMDLFKYLKAHGNIYDTL